MSLWGSGGQFLRICFDFFLTHWHTRTKRHLPREELRGETHDCDLLCVCMCVYMSVWDKNRERRPSRSRSISRAKSSQISLSPSQITHSHTHTELTIVRTYTTWFILYCCSLRYSSFRDLAQPTMEEVCSFKAVFVCLCVSIFLGVPGGAYLRMIRALHFSPLVVLTALSTPPPIYRK